MYAFLFFLKRDKKRCVIDVWTVTFFSRGEGGLVSLFVKGAFCGFLKRHLRVTLLSSINYGVSFESTCLSR